MAALETHKMPPSIANSLVPTDPAFYKELLDQMSDGVYFVDRSRQIHYWNAGAFRLTGYKSEDVVGKHCKDDILCHVDFDGNRMCKEHCPLADCIHSGTFREMNAFMRHKEGRRVPVHVRAQPLYNEQGVITGAIEIFSDISAEMETRRKIEEMRRLAFLDHLTQLPNRRFLELLTSTALTEFQVHGEPLGVLIFDVDGFKQINDRYGHSCGDRALCQLAQIVVSALRPSDTFGRWGGDEFLAIIRNVNAPVLRGLAERCVTLAGQTTIPTATGDIFSLSISIGAALSQADDSAQTLIERADKLMYRSKAAGRGCATTEE
jgi:diguanylate cyclase (GGDEF)-like protein/PAS domain S-box-containing protein